MNFGSTGSSHGHLRQVITYPLRSSVCKAERIPFFKDNREDLNACETLTVRPDR